MNLQFLIIDPQNDFAHVDGNLFVRGANHDAERLAILLKRHTEKIDHIHVTLDSHHWVDIAHPIFWVDIHGHSPRPFTQITLEDVLEGRWKTKNPDHQLRALHYVQTLQTHGRYTLTIWPPHCLIGRWGNNIVTPITEALNHWEQQLSRVNFVVKGANMWTEHYSAVQADVPDPEDPETQLNTALIRQLQRADLLVCSGQALSHCVANTLRDIAEYLSPDSLHKLVLLEDTTSPVTGFEALAEQFLYEMKARGMQTIKSTEFLV
jgi:nicotinamidase-related amidase